MGLSCVGLAGAQCVPACAETVCMVVSSLPAAMETWRISSGMWVYQVVCGSYLVHMHVM